jgi:hypothetical protein
MKSSKPENCLENLTKPEYKVQEHYLLLPTCKLSHGKFTFGLNLNVLTEIVMTLTH